MKVAPFVAHGPELASILTPRNLGKATNVIQADVFETRPTIVATPNDDYRVVVGYQGSIRVSDINLLARREFQADWLERTLPQHL